VSDFAIQESRGRSGRTSKCVLEGDFRPPRLLENAHLMTLAPSFAPLSGRPLASGGGPDIVKVAADSSLLAFRHFHPDSRLRPTFVLVHGLEGSSDSVYIVRLARKVFAAGANVVRVNLRNCGDSLHLTPTLYNAGQSSDILAVVDWLMRNKEVGEVFLVGYSLGGNLVLKAAAEMNGNYRPVGGVCAISPAIDLDACVSTMDVGFNRVYGWNFVQRLKEKITRKHKLFPERYNLANLSRISSLRMFDNLYTAPDAGYADAKAYYQSSSALPLISRIAVPTLVIAAQDDPLVPFASFVGIETDFVQLLAPRYGGHGAFIQSGARRDSYWADQQVLKFCFDKSTSAKL
jgi:predicted alpha/beta-fold hydrolase